MIRINELNAEICSIETKIQLVKDMLSDFDKAINMSKTQIFSEFLDQSQVATNNHYNVKEVVNSEIIYNTFNPRNYLNIYIGVINRTLGQLDEINKYKKVKEEYDRRIQEIRNF